MGHDESVFFFEKLEKKVRFSYFHVQNNKPIFFFEFKMAKSQFFRSKWQNIRIIRF